jgi:ATP-grasp domain
LLDDPVDANDVYALLIEEPAGNVQQPSPRAGPRAGKARRDCLRAARGLTLAVGLGGVWVEILKDSALLLPPVLEADVRRALGGLRAARLLTGARGTRPADLDKVAEVVTRIADLAGRLGPRLESLEINPLLVDGSRIEALDALITWR